MSKTMHKKHSTGGCIARASWQFAPRRSGQAGSLPHLARFRDQMPLDEVLVERDSQARAVWDFDVPVDGLDLFVGQLVAEGGVFDAVLEEEGPGVGAKPVQAGGDGDGAGVAVVAEAGPDFLHAVADVERVREAVAREIDLVDVEAAAVDEGAERLAAAFLLAGGDGDRRAVAEPAVPFVVVGIERLFQPADAELL